MLRVAICQFPVEADVRRNAGFIMRQMKRAAARGATIAQFCESALGVYPTLLSPEDPGFRDYDWSHIGFRIHSR